MLTPNVHRTGFRRYLATSSTATVFSTVLTVGKILTSAQAAALTIFPIGKSLTTQMIFFGAGTATQTFDYRVWLIYRLSDAAGALDPNSYATVILGAGTATLGSGTGVTNGTAVLSTEKLAHINVWIASGVATSPAGPAVIGQNALSEGNSAAYDADSPANDITVLYIPSNLRAVGLVVDFDMTGATSGNCLIMADEV